MAHANTDEIVRHLRSILKLMNGCAAAQVAQPPAPAAVPPVEVTVEIAPYERDRKDLPLKLDELVLYSEDQEVIPVTTLQPAKLLQIVRGTMLALSTLLERVQVDARNVKAFGEAQEAVERAAMTVHQRSQVVHTLKIRSMPAAVVPAKYAVECGVTVDLDGSDQPNERSRATVQRRGTRTGSRWTDAQRAKFAATRAAKRAAAAGTESPPPPLVTA
jgi:hypothetical protein